MSKQHDEVLILVVMEYGLGLYYEYEIEADTFAVLILVVMEYGLGHKCRAKH